MADNIVTAGQADRTPNWDKWRLIRSPQLWQCVALSLDIDPDKVNIYYDEMSGDVTFNESQEFQDRLHVLCANFGRDGVPAHPRSCPLSLRSFAAEVRRIGWKAPAELLAMADEHDLRKQETPTSPEGNAHVEPRTHNEREDLFRSRPPAPAESESHNSAPPSDLASQSGAGLATKRWSEAKQKREPVLVRAESVARERWKHCDDDHAEMTCWLQSEYSLDDGTLPFVDDTLTKYLLQRMAKVAREIGKPVKGEKKSPG